MDVCIYCGIPATTDDHVPPTCFLEEQLPATRATVRACWACNQRFSIHEQYAVALLTQIGTSAALAAKVKDGGVVDRAFTRRPAFEQRFLDRLEKDESGRVFIEAETERLGLVLRKVVAGLYWLRYSRMINIDDLGPIGFWPYNIVDMRPVQAFIATFGERFEPKRWAVAQKGVFEYMFANQLDGRLGCVINWHATLWVTCIVPRPGRGQSKRRPPGQEQLPFRASS